MPRRAAIALSVAIAAGACRSPRTDAGVVLYVDDDEIVVQHDEPIAPRVVPAVEVYRHGMDHIEALPPGTAVDLWIRRDENGRGTVERAIQTADQGLPPGFNGRGYRLRGVVVRADAASVMVDHEEIPGVMGAMVMPFAASGDTADRLTPGERVEGVIVGSPYGYALVAVEELGVAEAAPADEQASLTVGQRLPRYDLASSDGSEVVIGEGQGRKTILAFVYTTCPDPSFCPATVARLQGLQPDLLDDERIVAVTIDPDTDTVDVLARYASGVSADPARWVFARPTPTQLHTLAMLAGLTVSVTSGRIGHTVRLLVLDADGDVALVLEDNDWERDAVLRALRAPPPGGTP